MCPCGCHFSWTRRLYVGYKILMKDFDSVLFYFVLILTFSSYYNRVERVMVYMCTIDQMTLVSTVCNGDRSRYTSVSNGEHMCY
jgi:hypothetical protein